MAHSPEIIHHSTTTTETMIQIASHKPELSAVTTGIAAAVTWLDVLQGFLEWGVLVFGFIAGGFAVYWNLRRCYDDRRKSK